MPTFYHVSTDQCSPRGLKLTPRVPRGISPEEDQTIKRVCLAPTPKQCVMAIFGWPAAYFSLREWRTIKFLALYNIELSSEQYIIPSPDQVIDQYRTGEIWCLEEIQVNWVGFISMAEYSRTQEAIIIPRRRR